MGSGGDKPGLSRPAFHERPDQPSGKKPEKEKKNRHSAQISQQENQALFLHVFLKIFRGMEKKNPEISLFHGKSGSAGIIGDAGIFYGVFHVMQQFIGRRRGKNIHTMFFSCQRRSFFHHRKLSSGMVQLLIIKGSTVIINLNHKLTAGFQTGQPLVADDCLIFHVGQGGIDII